MSLRDIGGAGLLCSVGRYDVCVVGRACMTVPALWRSSPRGLARGRSPTRNSEFEDCVALVRGDEGSRALLVLEVVSANEPCDSARCLFERGEGSEG